VGGINLEEIDLQAVATGIISFPKCNWSERAVMEIVAEEKSTE
jgi:hypothetical protein